MTTLLITTIIALTVAAEAHHSSSRYNTKQKSSIYISGYTANGHAIYTKRVAIGLDRFGRQIFRYYGITPQSKYKHHAIKYSPRKNYSKHCQKSYRGSTKGYSPHKR